MKRFPILLMLALAALSGVAGILWAASSRGLQYHALTVYDENGKVVTDVNHVTILVAGSDVNDTVYADRDLSLKVRQPMGLATDNTTLDDGYFTWYGPSAFDLKVTSTTLGSCVYRGLTQADGRVQLPRYMPQLAGVAWVSVELTNADIKALRATPKELVAAPGAGYVLIPLEATLILDYGSNALTESTDNLIIGWNAGAVQAGEVIEAGSFIDATADTITSWHMAKDEVNAASGVVNKNLALKNNGDGEFSGNAGNDTTMTVSLLYRIVPVGL